MKNKITHILLSLCACICISSCNLEYENTEAITPDNVWKDKKMINAFFNDIHAKSMPEWPLNGNDSDEGLDRAGSMTDYQRGIIDVERTGKGLNYETIEKINFFLERLAAVDETIISSNEKKQLAGQALFWRAWDYWGKVKIFGGVPLVLKRQDVTDKESLFIPRSKTSECVDQILKDLDEAIATLPDSWNSENYGRIDKGTALAFKGRILLYYASPLFNSTNDKSRWEAAYNTNQEALAVLKKAGKELYSGKFEDIWYNERNSEVVMVNQFYYPDHVYNNASIRPYPYGSAGSNFPFLPLLMAFPKKDGSRLSLDITKLSDPVYNSNFMKQFYTERDDRFYATIYSGGTVYPTGDFPENVRYWYVWKKETEQTSPSGFRYSGVNMDQLGASLGGGITGFFQLKGLYKKPHADREQSTVDWVEIRFAEVLMNFGECANELGKTNEALQVLYDIRKRGGIAIGNGSYGIVADNQVDVREAYISERFVEFAFEGKRWEDLRRWKRFDILNKYGFRSGLYTVINNNADLKNFDWKEDIMDSEVREKFHVEFVPNLDGNGDYKFNLSLNHWFYPIKKEDLDRNSKLEQNKEWGGTFDPLL